jgi:uncharacterized protein (TIGR02271 family)
MSKTIVGLFDDASEARSVVTELTQMGVTRDHISLMANRDATATAPTDETVTESAGSDALTGAGIGAMLGGVGGLLVGLAVLPIPGLGPIIAAGPIATTLAGMGIGAAAGGVVGALVNVGVPEEHAAHYAEAVRRGGTLVTVEADEEQAQRVADVMNRHHAVDVNQRAETWRKTGWSGYDVNAPAYRADEIARERDTYRNLDIDKGQVTIPVVQEQLAVGKREVERGGVRVFNRVIEQPVTENVQLRDERVKVERHAVNRPVSGIDSTAFREGTMEFKETVEEPVVSKTARVVEEVVINKDVNERTQTVRDTVKRTEVDVQATPRASQVNPATPRNPR